MPSLCQFSEGFHVVNVAVNLVHRFQFSYRGLQVGCPQERANGQWLSRA